MHDCDPGREGDLGQHDLQELPVASHGGLSAARLVCVDVREREAYLAAGSGCCDDMARECEADSIQLE